MKPIVRLIGNDGNVFGVIGIVTNALQKSGMKQQADEFRDKAFNSDGYDAVLRLVQEYVEVR